MIISSTESKVKEHNQEIVFFRTGTRNGVRIKDHDKSKLSIRWRGVDLKC